MRLAPAPATLLRALVQALTIQALVLPLFLGQAIPGVARLGVGPPAGALARKALAVGHVLLLGACGGPQVQPAAVIVLRAVSAARALPLATMASPPRLPVVGEPLDALGAVLAPLVREAVDASPIRAPLASCPRHATPCPDGEALIPIRPRWSREVPVQRVHTKI